MTGYVPISRNDLKMCNCASCCRTLLSRDHTELMGGLSKSRRADFPPFVGERIGDRPYCEECLLRMAADEPIKQ